MEQINLDTLPRSRKEALALGEKYYFKGKPCKRGHLAKMHVNRGCMQCIYEREMPSKLAWAKAHREQRRLYEKDWYDKNKLRVACARKAAHRVKTKREWEERNKDLKNARRRQRYASSESYRRQIKAHVANRHHRARDRRGISGCNSKALIQRLGLFDGRCCYCGETAKTTADHFIALAAGGTHVPSNIVPACPRCNSSKQNKDPETWFRAQPFFTEKRWQQILKAVGKAKQHHGQLSLL